METMTYESERIDMEYKAVRAADKENEFTFKPSDQSGSRTPEEVIMCVKALRRHRVDSDETSACAAAVSITGRLFIRHMTTPCFHETRNSVPVKRRRKSHPEGAFQFMCWSLSLLQRRSTW